MAPARPETGNECLLIRADASALIGGGHIMRCLALANAWSKEGGKVVFVCAEITPQLHNRISQSGYYIHTISAQRGTGVDRVETNAIADDLRADVVVLDGYCFSAGYQAGLRDSGKKVVVYDDQGDAPAFCCDILVNQNIHAHPAQYEHRADGAILLMGVQYAALREEFHEARSCERDFSRCTKVLVSLGLGDTTKILIDILECLLASTKEHLEIVILTGASDIGRIETIAKKAPHEIYCHETTGVFAEKLLEADIAIIAAGGTANEAACLATPMIMICIAANQVPAYREFIRRGIALDGGFSDTFNAAMFRTHLESLLQNQNIRTSLGGKGREAVDGEGAGRVAREIRRLGSHS